MFIFRDNNLLEIHTQILTSEMTKYLQFALKHSNNNKKQQY